MNVQSDVFRLPAKAASTRSIESDIRIEELSPDLESAWDEYVAESSDCSPFHELGWMRAVERVYGHRPHYLVATSDSGRLMGLLPLFEVSGPLTGRAIISVPYAVYGGASALNAPVAEALHDSTKSLADSTEARYA